MIVISPSLTLAQLDEEGLPLNYPVIGWHNVAHETNIATTTAQSGYPASNLANVQTSSLWKGEAGSEETITVTPDTADELDYIAVAGHNWGSAGIEVSVEIDGVEVIAGMVLPDDGPALFRVDPQTMPSVSFVLQPGTEAPEAAVIYVGKLLVMQRGVQGDYTPLPYARIANVVNGRSEAGDFLGRIVTSSKVESDARFTGLMPTWVRANLEPFLKVVAVTPFFFAWNPQDFPREVGFAWATNNPQPSFTIDGWCNFDLQLAGIVA